MFTTLTLRAPVWRTTSAQPTVASPTRHGAPRQFMHKTSQVKTWWAGAALALLLALHAAPALAALNVSGTISTNTVWTAAQSPIQLQGDVVLDQNATLTIQPGVQISMQPAASFTLRSGALQAIGTSSQPIVVTSAAANPAAGDWGQWRFLQGTQSAQTTLDNVRIEYGSGIVIEKASPTIQRTAINHHNGPAIQIDLESSPVGQDLTATGNQINAIVVPAGVIRGQVSWGLVGIPYLVQQGIVSVGALPMVLEPAYLKTSRNVTSTINLHFGIEPPPRDEPIYLFNSNPAVVSVPSLLRSPGPGFQGVQFEIIPQTCGNSKITAAYSAWGPFLGLAQTQLLVECLPKLQFLYPDYGGWQNVFNWAPSLVYTVIVGLPNPAPAGGQIVQLRSKNGSLESVAPVTVAAGQSSATFTVQPKSLGGFPYANDFLIAEAAGYEFVQSAIFIAPMEFGFEASSSVNVGETSEIYWNLSAVAPKNGLRVQVESSAPNTIEVITAQILVPEGERYGDTIVLRGKNPGQARVRIFTPGVFETFIDMEVKP